MAKATVVKPQNNNGYGYIEFVLDGTDYTGWYSSETSLPYMNHTYQYKIEMSKGTNLVGNEIYTFYVEYFNKNNRPCSTTYTGVKGTKARLCSGKFSVFEPFARGLDGK